jgi:hypothetical protein
VLEITCLGRSIGSRPGTGEWQGSTISGDDEMGPHLDKAFVAMVAVLMVTGSGNTVAQNHEQPPAVSAPRLPDGIMVTPPSRRLLPSSPDERARMPSPGLERSPAPRYHPHGGCRYDEQQLELIV